MVVILDSMSKPISGSKGRPKDSGLVDSIVITISELLLSCIRLLVGRVTAVLLSYPLSVSQQSQLSLPFRRGRLFSSIP